MNEQQFSTADLMTFIKTKERDARSWASSEYCQREGDKFAAVATALEQGERMEQALRDLIDAAWHLRHCVDCAQTSAEDCHEGRTAIAAIKRAETALSPSPNWESK